LYSYSGVNCELSQCTSCYPSNPLCGSGFAVIAMGGDTGAISLTGVSTATVGGCTSESSAPIAPESPPEM
jgi:hypothetical protein